jgi:DnaK suppressor protein
MPKNNQDTQVEEYRLQLLQLKQSIINDGAYNNTDDLKISSEDLPDEADIATNVINQQVSFTIRNRLMEKLKFIEEALYRVDQGSYGICEECDEPIASKRLKTQPFTTLCITHAEELEREQNQQFRKLI